MLWKKIKMADVLTSPNFFSRNFMMEAPYQRSTIHLCKYSGNLKKKKDFIKYCFRLKMRFWSVSIQMVHGVLGSTPLPQNCAIFFFFFFFFASQTSTIFFHKMCGVVLDFILNVWLPYYRRQLWTEHLEELLSFFRSMTLKRLWGK